MKLVVALAMLTSLLFGCGGGDGTKVGLVVPLSGNTATYGEEAHNGMKMAIEEINSGKHGEGPKLQLVAKDDKGDSAETAKLVEQLAQVDGVKVIVGSVASTNTLRGGRIAQEIGVPLVAPVATAIEVTQDRPYVSRICFIDSTQGTSLANLSYNDLGKRKAAILIDRASDFSVGLAASFKDTFLKLGGSVAAEESFSAGQADYSALITKVVAAEPDVIFIPAYYPEIGGMLRQAGDKWSKIPVVSGDGLDSPDLFKLMGNYSGPIYMSTHFAPDDVDPKVKNFVQTYTATFNKAPGSLSVLGYDAVFLIWDAMKRVGTEDKAALAKAIAETKNFAGVTGNITLDENRNAIKDVVILKVENGGWVFHSRVKAQ